MIIVGLDWTILGGDLILFFILIWSVNLWPGYVSNECEIIALYYKHEIDLFNLQVCDTHNARELAGIPYYSTTVVLFMVIGGLTAIDYFDWRQLKNSHHLVTTDDDCYFIVSHHQLY